MVLSKVVKKVTGRLEQMQPEAPKNTMQVVFMLAEAMRYGYTETLGTWNLFDLPTAIIHAVTDKDKKTVASECDERSDCVQLKAPGVLDELYEVKKLLTRAMLFSSRKRFGAFLFAAGFAKEDVLLRKRTARILKPAFTVIRDKESKCLFVFIRGTRSIKDTLTDAIAAPIPFSHRFISSDGKLRRNNTVSGHAHRGMVTAARWIRRHCTSTLLDALQENPDFKIKIIGHSLGGGTAALLTFMLREMKQFSSCTCVMCSDMANPSSQLYFFAAACMTLELAEFGKPFITSIINGYDIVPTLSASSVHDFIYKVHAQTTSPSLIKMGRIKDKNILTAVGSRLSFAKAITGHAVTRCTQVVKKHQQRTQSLLPCSQRENIETSDDLVKASQSWETSCETLLTEEHVIIESVSDDEEYNSSSEGSDGDDDDSDDDKDKLSNIHAKDKEATTTKNITEEESVCPVPTSVNLDRHPLYPPGKIMHIVPENNNSNRKYPDKKRIYLYETPTQFYGKLRFSRGIILDHLTKKYLKKLQQLINQLEKEQSKFGGL
ncbi:Sn1-specific diacylglycerol lipase alpha [Glycine max]|nr:Sn1-specific diacylglycerol lipase alpha [Glycine max]